MTVTELRAPLPRVHRAPPHEDPNWGRIIAAVGRSGVLIDPKNLSLQLAMLRYTPRKTAGEPPRKACPRSDEKTALYDDD